MSSTVTETITEPQQAAQFIYDLLKANQEALSIGFLGINERLRPEYPAVIVLAGGRDKTPHMTHIFLVVMEVIINVWHANLNASHSFRTEEDLNMVTEIENLIESDTAMNMGGRVVTAYVRNTRPVPGNRSTGEAVVGTQMIVYVESRKGFPHVP